MMTELCQVSGADILTELATLLAQQIFEDGIAMLGRNRGEVEGNLPPSAPQSFFADNVRDGIYRGVAVREVYLQNYVVPVLGFFGQQRQYPGGGKILGLTADGPTGSAPGGEGGFVGGGNVGGGIDPEVLAQTGGIEGSVGLHVKRSIIFLLHNRTAQGRDIGVL